MAHRPFTVAVMEDDQGMLGALKHLLESGGCSVRVFTSATALLDSGYLPDIGCLISNIDMPGMDDFEPLTRIHAARAALPTILITDWPERLDRLPAGLKGIYPGLFTKPFDAQDLLAAVGQIRRHAT